MEQQPHLSHEGMMAILSLLNRINAKYIFPSESSNHAVVVSMQDGMFS